MNADVAVVVAGARVLAADSIESILVASALAVLTLASVIAIVVWETTPVRRWRRALRAYRPHPFRHLTGLRQDLRLSGLRLRRTLQARRAVQGRIGPTVPRRVQRAMQRARLESFRKSAGDEILALGAELESRKTPTVPAALAEYALALDAYDAAGRTVNRATGIADWVGALVLARMGAEHLRRAAGRNSARRVPISKPCFFDPTHSRALDRAQWGQVTVWVCSTCRSALKQGVQPDTLLVPSSNGYIPYYESEIEPWASTGYGALRDDLLTQVLTGFPDLRKLD